MKRFLYYSLSFIMLCSIFTSCKGKTKPLEDKVIYLTFDDGPCQNTLKILETLDKFNVKATFFVVGKNAKKYPEILKTIHKKKHSIGLHSHSHIYREIYKNKTALINDINLCLKDIQEIIPNFKASIYRFPGGSFNINNEFKELVLGLGYSFFDWNASTLDAEGNFTPYEIFCNTKKTIGKKNNVILLCHDIKPCTALALYDIISYYKNKGYIFKTL